MFSPSFTGTIIILFFYFNFNWLYILQTREHRSAHEMRLQRYYFLTKPPKFFQINIKKGVQLSAKSPKICTVAALLVVAGAIETVSADTVAGQSDGLNQILQTCELQAGETQAMGNLIDHTLIFWRVSL